MDYFTLEIVGLTRKLPLIQVGRHTKIASFSILGDVELVDALADAIYKKVKPIQFDYIVGPEVKAVPLIHGIAKRLGHKRFVICRKSIKPYMVQPIKVNPLSHFPKHAKPLVINGEDALLLKSKKVLIIDDVISSGITMRMMTYLVEKLGAEVVGYFAAIKQGSQFDEFKNLHYLVEIPIVDTKSDS
jgi:adenine phosphoribosyltransferase